ncbi:MFS general substrate transporter [Daedaleopsis nitida]|nr:MFS general substrate transporter [Daedaleopsis nitida]
MSMEKAVDDATPSDLSPEMPNIEHAAVTDDPRAWSDGRKLWVVVTVSLASAIGALGANIYNPAISQIEEELHASSSLISLSLSIFILIHGVVPLLWSVLSEFWGRKKVYLCSSLLCMVGCIVAAVAKTIDVLIGMRCIQAFGGSAMTSLGAATLADIYDPSRRGTMMGIYYSAPLLGPALGPIIGGALSQAFDWRATFWFLAIFVGLCFLSFIPFKDTFRRERSATYQAALRRRREQMTARGSETEASTLSQMTAVSRVVPTEKSEPPASSKDQTTTIERVSRSQDLERQQEPEPTGSDAVAPLEDFELSLADVNPIQPIFHILRRVNNLIILPASGLIFGFSYCIAYTCSRTLAEQYGYNALHIGLVLLTFGVGSLIGSVLGGRYSDYVLNRLKARNGGKSTAEMRLESTFFFMPFFPISVLAYGWVCEQHVNVAAICVTLLLSGFFSTCVYASTYAYIVDANSGRSSSAAATNSTFRGVTAFVATEVAVPLQDAIGDGGMYSLWAGLLVLSELMILLVWWKGHAWRQKWELVERGAATASGLSCRW